MKRITCNELRPSPGWSLMKENYILLTIYIKDYKHVNLTRSIALKIFHIRTKIFKESIEQKAIQNTEIQRKEVL